MSEDKKDEVEGHAFRTTTDAFDAFANKEQGDEAEVEGHAFRTTTDAFDAFDAFKANEEDKDDGEERNIF